jgi:hypothetical protein
MSTHPSTPRPRAGGNIPAEFELESPPRRVPSIVHPNLRTAATPIVPYLGSVSASASVSFGRFFVPSIVRPRGQTSTRIFWGELIGFHAAYCAFSSIKHWTGRRLLILVVHPLSLQSASHLPRWSLPTCLPPDNHSLPLTQSLRHAFYLYLLSCLRPLTRALQDQPQRRYQMHPNGALSNTMNRQPTPLLDVPMDSDHPLTITKKVRPKSGLYSSILPNGKDRCLGEVIPGIFVSFHEPSHTSSQVVRANRCFTHVICISYSDDPGRIVETSTWFKDESYVRALHLTLPFPLIEAKQTHGFIFQENQIHVARDFLSLRPPVFERSQHHKIGPGVHLAC